MKPNIVPSVMIAIAMSQSGCWFSKKPKAQTPPPPPPISQVPRAAKGTPAPKAAPAKAPPKKKPATTSTPRVAPPAAHPPKAAETTKPAPKTEEAPRLGQILSADQINEYRSNYERSSSAAREMLRTIDDFQIPPEKRDSVARIRSFLAQAQEASASDWAMASQLAYRAEVLARDLIRTLQ